MGIKEAVLTKCALKKHLQNSFRYNSNGVDFRLVNNLCVCRTLLSTQRFIVQYIQCSQYATVTIIAYIECALIEF